MVKLIENIISNTLVHKHNSPSWQRRIQTGYLP